MSPVNSLDFLCGTDGFDEEDAVEPVSMSTTYECAPRVREAHGSVRGAGGEGQSTGGDPCGLEPNP